MSDAKPRCPRCHRPPPNANGCAICAPEILGARLIATIRTLKAVTAERDEWRRKALRDPTGLATMLWSEAYAQVGEANQRHMLERDAARASVAELAAALDALLNAFEWSSARRIKEGRRGRPSKAYDDWALARAALAKAKGTKP